MLVDGPGKTTASQLFNIGGSTRDVAVSSGFEGNSTTSPAKRLSDTEARDQMIERLFLNSRQDPCSAFGYLRNPFKLMWSPNESRYVTSSDTLNKLIDEVFWNEDSQKFVFNPDPKLKRGPGLMKIKYRTSKVKEFLDSKLVDFCYSHRHSLKSNLPDADALLSEGIRGLDFDQDKQQEFFRYYAALNEQIGALLGSPSEDNPGELQQYSTYVKSPLSISKLAQECYKMVHSANQLSDTQVALDRDLLLRAFASVIRYGELLHSVIQKGLLDSSIATELDIRKFFKEEERFFKKLVDQKRVTDSDGAEVRISDSCEIEFKGIDNLPGLVHCDGDKLQILVRNLLNNSIENSLNDNTGDKHSILFEVKYDDNQRLHIKIQNPGSIENEDEVFSAGRSKPKLFTVNGDFGVQGQGLKDCKRICQDYFAGDIRLSSSGNPVEFTLDLNMPSH